MEFATRLGKCGNVRAGRHSVWPPNPGGRSASRAGSWHAAGIRLYAWTVDNQADWQRLPAWPVDVLITNKPIAYTAGARQQC
jgi:glycerophosphoryl diester phosphodiesterase